MMKLRRTLCFVVAISIVFGCVGMVAAEDVPKVAAVERATGSFKTTVKQGCCRSGRRCFLWRRAKK